jgi:uncharacterized LabA/DUF88 family protein
VGKNVAVFVDVANIFYAAKAAGVDIDYVTLLKSAIAGRDFVRAYAYTGLDPDNENQRNFHSFLARHSYKVVSKDIRKYGDGKVKANLDIELVVDLMKTARNLDVAIIVSGDGDFAPAIRAVQEMGVRCEVISFRGNTSSDLIEVADLFTDITQIAKVEKGSSRSGRRVADDEEDLSMTEVPDKQTEGTGIGRGRGSRTGRGRTRVGEPEPVAAAPRSAGTRPAARGGRRPAGPVVLEAAIEGSPVAAVGASAPSFGGLVALPGEKLSKSAIAAAAVVIPPTVAPLDADLEPEVDDEDAPEVSPVEGESETEEGQRRRRRRGGRGRGRGRSRAEGEPAAGTGTPPREIVARPPAVDEEDEEDLPVAPRPPRSAAFGSFWDSQIGMDRPPAASLSPLDVDDEDEPAIPEYLIAEQRRGNRDGGRDVRRPGGGAPNRGGRTGSYAAAMERERFGRGGGGGINRYPDVSGRRPEERPRGDERPAAAPRQDRPRSGDEPWSEVPPELEAMLRAQIASKPGRPSEGRPAGGRPAEARPATGQQEVRPRMDAAVGEAASPVRRGRPPKAADAAPAEPAAVAGSGAAVLPGPKRRTTSRRAAEAAAPVVDAGPASGRATTDAPAVAPAPRRRSSARATAEAAPAAARSEEAAPAAAPAVRRRVSTRTAAPVTPAEVEASAEAAAPAPKRRSTRKVAE